MATLRSLTNSGSLTVSADANADAGTRVVGVGTTATTVVGDAFASASVEVGVFQAANGLKDNVSTRPSGVIDITNAAKARGNNIAGTGTTTTGTGTTQVVTTFPTPGAIAFVRTGIHQNAYATGLTTVGAGTTATLAGGVAAVSLTNDGSINVGAVATASGTGQVMASAAVDQGIRQDAGANGGDASASLDNTGSITVAATANATGGNATRAWRSAPGPRRGPPRFRARSLRSSREFTRSSTPMRRSPPRQPPRPPGSATPRSTPARLPAMLRHR